MKDTHQFTGDVPTNRRTFLKSMAGATVLGLPSLAATGEPWRAEIGKDQRTGVRALLISATTVEGMHSLEHAGSELKKLYGERRRILLINFASLPEDRDAYEMRMKRDLLEMDSRYEVSSLHRVKTGEAGPAIRQAEAFFVSGGNTFLLLRELYDRFVVDLLRERVFQGIPYAGSSAGSNIAGETIGTTNDFPITDVPTRRCLGLFSGVYNPHHPEANEPLFGSRQWKIGEYARYNPGETVYGVTNSGMLRLHEGRITLLGDGASAFINKGGIQFHASSEDSPDLGELLGTP